MPEARVGQQEGGCVDPSSVVTLRPNGFREATWPKSLLKSATPGSGQGFDRPAEMLLQRMPFAQQAAVKRMPASRLALAMPITL